MSVMKMACWNFRTNLRDHCPLLLSVAFSILVFLNFLMILFTDVFSVVGESEQVRINGVISASSFVLGCFMLFFIWYSANIFLDQHKKDSGVYILMGLNSKSLGRLYMTETLMMGVVVLATGGFFGTLTTELFQMILGAVSDVEVKLDFQFAVEPFLITAVVVLFLHAVFAVWGYRDIVRSSVTDMIQVSVTRESGMIRPQGLVYRTILGLGSLFGGYYLSVRQSSGEEICMLFLAGILVIVGIYQLFGGLIPMLFRWLTDNKQFLYRKERALWINNAACRLRKNYRTYATTCVLMLCAMTVLTVGYAVKERYAMYGESGWIGIVYAVAIWIFMVFVMAGGSAMLVKVHGDASEEREQYVFLRKMGMDQEIFDRAITRELCTVYVCPFVLTAVSSYFFTGALEKLMAVNLRSVYLVNLFLIFLFFAFLYLLSVTLYRKNTGNG